jgi:putative membrane protein
LKRWNIGYIKTNEAESTDTKRCRIYYAERKLRLGTRDAIICIQIISGKSGKIKKKGRWSMMNWGNYGWGMGFGWIFMVLFWVLVVFGVAYIVQSVTRKGAGQSKSDETPIDILKKRYAKGEITKEEFERMKEELLK